MIKKLVASVALLAASLFASAQQYHPVQMTPVTGQVISRGMVVPGVTVSLIHPVLGRSAPSFTDAYGRFGWNAIPIRPEPYYVEVYWGPNLVYRNIVYVGSPNPVNVPIVM